MHINRRQQLGDPGAGTSRKTIAIVLVIVITLLISCIVCSFWYFNRRAKQLQKAHGYNKRKSWRESIQSVSSALQFQSIPPPTQPSPRNSTFTVLSNHRLSSIEVATAVDRNTSVRSVMTLPAYSAVPHDGEGVVAREGERAGMDAVVEFAESDREEEARREEEMESLYQIRRIRREEVEAREERRRLRREARDRGDLETLHALRQESQRARRDREISGSEALILDHELRPRSRRVSAVSYGALGVARHDGTRVRTSGESERPLLDAAGTIDISGPIRPWVSRDGLLAHRRGHSSLSSLSIASRGSDNDSIWSEDDSVFDGLTPQQSRSRTQSRTRARSSPRTLSRPRSVATIGRGSDTDIRTTSHGRPPALALDTAGIQATQIPLRPPPPYTPSAHTRIVSPQLADPTQEVPTPASRPVSEAPSLPEIRHLPSIRLIEGTPIDQDSSLESSYPRWSVRRNS